MLHIDKKTHRSLQTLFIIETAILITLLATRNTHYLIPTLLTTLLAGATAVHMLKTETYITLIDKVNITLFLIGTTLIEIATITLTTVLTQNTTETLLTLLTAEQATKIATTYINYRKTIKLVNKIRREMIQLILREMKRATATQNEKEQ